MGRSSLSIIAIEQSARAAALALMLGFFGDPAFSAPVVTIKNTNYEVDATSVKELTKQLKRRGPNGFWAYTSWRIEWSRSCDVSVSVTYTLPEHSNVAALPPQLRKDWERMIRALKLHEEQHGAHGIAAAQEIEQAGCRKFRRIVRKYRRADRELDRLTQHGVKTGVIID